MARVSRRPVDPTRDTAALLRRIGFFALMGGLPLAGFSGRGGVVVLFVIGIVLVLAAAFLDGETRSFRSSLEQVTGSTPLLALFGLFAWAALSLAWTPVARAPGMRLLGLTALGGLALAGYAALPGRMRSANLYVLPAGVGLAGVAGLALAAFGPDLSAPDAARRMERGLSVLILCTWPAIGWLRSRVRDGEAIGLALLVAAATAFGPNLTPALALAVGALTYLVVQIAGRGGAWLVGFCFAAMILVAPLLLALPWPGLPARGGQAAGWLASLAAWRPALLGDPLRLVTGHGLGSVRLAGASLTGSGGVPAFTLWYEFGVVGVSAVAVALWRSLDVKEGELSPLKPGIAGAVGTFCSLAALGSDGSEPWLLATLAAVALFFVAGGRGQFRTRRPGALGLGRTRAA